MKGSGGGVDGREAHCWCFRVSGFGFREKQERNHHANQDGGGQNNRLSADHKDHDVNDKNTTAWA